MSRQEREFDPEEVNYLSGEIPAAELNLMPPKKLKSFIESVHETRSPINAGHILADFKVRTEFDERGAGWRIFSDPIGLVRKVAGKVETYEENIKKQEKKGKKEAASFGLAKIDDKRFVLYAMHSEYMAGTLGVVAGEKFQEAADLAAKENTPLITEFYSGGARQQENFAALVQMERIPNAIDHFKSKTKHPYIAILSGQVWGGISASAVPLADIIIGLEGTNVGFSGPRVIEAAEGVPVPPGEQTAENHTLHRNVDLILKPDERIPYIGQLFNSLQKGEKLSLENLPKPDMTERISTERKFYFEGENRFISPLEKPTTAKKILKPSPVEKRIYSNKATEQSDKLYDQYIDLLRDANRFDTESLTNAIFSDVTKLYNAHEEVGEKGNSLNYPSRIASIGKIGEQPFLIIGDMPSYFESYDRTVKKQPSSPEPKDFEFQLKMLDFGARVGLPLVYMCDTPGAKPSLEAERNRQWKMIAEVIDANNKYPHPVISIVTGLLGSGGGLTAAPIGDHRVMLSKALACVSEPRSATSILYNTANPEVNQIKTTLGTMRATGADELDLKLIDAVIEESDSISVTAKRLYVEIAQAYIENESYSQRKRLSIRKKRIRGLRGIGIKK